MMSLHKLTAGDGYQYLTKQVAASDNELLERQSLGDYYSEKGEKPGQWIGSGLAGLAGTGASIQEGSVVTSEQMAALYGVGRNPDAASIEKHTLTSALASGMTKAQAIKAAEKASRLGRVFDDPGKPTEFVIEIARAYEAYNVARGMRRSAAIPNEERAKIKSKVGASLFEKQFGFAPRDSRELSGFVAREGRPRQQACAGYDLTFSPVKSVSTLWALADRDTAIEIEEAHSAAINATLEWLEKEVIYTRRGAKGARSVNASGLLAAAFVHRDSRSGDPDLHTHVAIANKVQDPTDGAWLSIDGQVLYKHTVAASEMYNLRLQAELTERLGVEWAERKTERRSVFEIVGMDENLHNRWSSRRTSIEDRLAELVGEFSQTHGRVPTSVESYSLAQQANLDTRQKKHEHRSEAEQRATWREEASEALGGYQQIEALIKRMIPGVLTGRMALDEDLRVGLASSVLNTIEASRATFQIAHVEAEVSRRLAGLGLTPEGVDTERKQLIKMVLEDAVSLAASEEIQDPNAFCRADGTSVYARPKSTLYTTRNVVEAETTIIEACDGRAAHTATASDARLAVLTAAAAGINLNDGQRVLVSEMATSGRAVQLALAPAGTGKTTAMRALADAWRHSGGDVIALAPTAVAASELGSSIGSDAHTIDSFLGRYRRGSGQGSGVSSSTMIVVDEAGMIATPALAELVACAREQGATVRLIGDDQQLAAVGAGGVLRDIASTYGAISLREVVRFTDSAEADASLALRAGRAQEALGWYLDASRVRATSVLSVVDDAFEAWRADTESGRQSLMIAQSRAMVDQLNDRARVHRLVGAPKPEHEVRLSSGLNVSQGDVIVTRRNAHKLRITTSDFVKNGDRWTVQSVTPDGSLSARHHGTDRVITIPSDYVSEHVDLGYATTVYGAQGQTVDTSHAIFTGSEDRQSAYVALTRGRHLNTAFVAIGGDGDEHNQMTPDQLLPRTAAESLLRVFSRDGAAVSAASTAQSEADPIARLSIAAAAYSDAIGHSAELIVGQQRIADYAAFAESIHPGLTDSHSWEALAQEIALHEIAGQDPIAHFDAVYRRREVGSARNPANVLLWRMRAETDTPGPLAWLRGVPEALRSSAYGPWLQERGRLVKATEALTKTVAAGWTRDTAPVWAQRLISDPELMADVAVWRASTGISDEDLTSLGPRPKDRLLRSTYDAFATRITELTGTADSSRWIGDVDEHRVVTDPWWPILEARLDELALSDTWISADIVAALQSDSVESPQEILVENLSAVRAPSVSTSLFDNPRLVEANEAAERFYARHLRSSWADDYLTGRGFSHLVDAAEAHGMGLAPTGRTELTDWLTAPANGAFTIAELVEAGLVIVGSNGPYDRFRNRLMMAIRGVDEVTGRVRTVGFSGRAHPDADLSKTPKYLNTNATPIYDKGAILDGLADNLELLRGGAVPVIVEGRLDAEAITAASGGRAVGLAPGGTALTATQIETLGRYVDLSTTKIVVATDDDQAGRKASARAWRLLTEAGARDTRTAWLPAGMDPAELFKANPEDLLLKSVDSPVPLIHRRIGAALEGLNLDHKFAQIEAVRSLREDINSSPEDQRSWAVSSLVGRLTILPETVTAILDSESAEEAEWSFDEQVAPEVLSALIAREMAEPLPDEQPAAALWARLRSAIESPDNSVPMSSTPEQHLVQAIGVEEAMTVIDEPEWKAVDRRLRDHLIDGRDDTLGQLVESLRSEGHAVTARSLLGRLTDQDAPQAKDQPERRKDTLNELRKSLAEQRARREAEAKRRRGDAGPDDDSRSQTRRL